MNKQKVLKKLKTLTWEELDWLEQQCRKHKENADGVRVYSNCGDETHQREMGRAMVDYFDDVLFKHHGI